MTTTQGSVRAGYLRNFRKAGRSNLHSSRRPDDGSLALSWNRTFNNPGST